MYLVVVKMLWYKADNTTVAGWAKHRVDRYTEDDGTNHDYPIDGCSDRYLN